MTTEQTVRLLFPPVPVLPQDADDGTKVLWSYLSKLKEFNFPLVGITDGAPGPPGPPGAGGITAYTAVSSPDEIDFDFGTDDLILATMTFTPPLDSTVILIGLSTARMDLTPDPAKLFYVSLYIAEGVDTLVTTNESAWIHTENTTGVSLSVAQFIVGDGAEHTYDLHGNYFGRVEGNMNGHMKSNRFLALVVGAPTP